MKVRQLTPQKGLRYLLVGGYNTIFGFLCFSGLYYLLGSRVHYLFLTIVCQFLSVSNAFIGYRCLVFKSSGNIFLEYLRFNVVYAASYIVSLFLMFLSVDIIGLHPILGQAVSILITVLVSYFGHSRFSFVSKQERVEGK